MPPGCRTILYLAVFVMGLLPSMASAAERTPLLLDNMDGPKPALHLLDATGGVQVLRQAIEHGEGELSESEHLTLAIPPGAGAQLAYSLPPQRVIAESRLEAWAWCSRPGMQIGAIVVLPRSKKDEVTGNDRQLLIRSGVNVDGGGWQQLVLNDLPNLLERHARVARKKYGPDINEAEAYISHLVILAPGGNGPTDLWVDKIAMYGALGPRVSAPASQPPAPIDLAAVWSAADTKPGASTVNTPRRDPPAIPRIIQWQGEPLEQLKRMGFDTIWMGRLPNASELAEVNRLGLWLVCPPPPPAELEAHGVGRQFDAVLAWDLGELASQADVPLAEAQARALDRFDSVATRPTVLRQLAMAREASRIADIVVLGISTIGATSSSLEQGAGLVHARRLARAGASVWYAVDTQRSARSIAQLSALRGTRAPAGAATYDRLCQATTAALGVRPRGFIFQSESSLVATDPETRTRSLAIELMNMRLAMVEPWLAHGRTATTATTSKPEQLTALVLTAERSHLVIPMRWNDDAASNALAPTVRGAVGSLHNSGDGPTSFVLPGVPESCEAYLLSAAGPRHVPTKRVTGGLNVSVDHLPADAFLLLTEDGYAFTHVQRFLQTAAPRAAQARVELAALDRQQAVSSIANLSPALLKSASADRDMAVVDASMAAIHNTLASRDYSAAFARAEASAQTLEVLRQRLFLAMWPDGDAGASPFRGDWATLPDLERVATIARNAAVAPQSLSGGEFEDLERLLKCGWRRSDESPPGIKGSVRLSPEGPYAGQYCLELAAVADHASASPPSLVTPPVWITSPPMSVPPGNLVEITGWARISETPLGSADPLLIFDSIGGEESAVRIATAPTWTRFRLVRAAPPGAELRVTIALGGVGRAAVDSLEYRFIPLPVSPAVASR